MDQEEQQSAGSPHPEGHSLRHLPLATRIKLWAEMVDESEALLKAGLRAKIGPSGDLQAAYREWYARRMEEHDLRQIELLENLSRRERDMRCRTVHSDSNAS
jgi:hypothetical protein